jgi:hypothetical protein
MGRFASTKLSVSALVLVLRVGKCHSVRCCRVVVPDISLTECEPGHASVLARGLNVQLGALILTARERAELYWPLTSGSMMSRSYWLLGLTALSLGCGQPPVVIDAGGAGGDDSGVPKPKPEVLLLVDTSGSNVVKAGCTPDPVGPRDCLPSCSSGERPRWHDVLEAVVGSFENYRCVELERTAANGATFDEGYMRPFHRLGAQTRQRADGLLDRYWGSVVFGLATFDSMRTYRGASDLVPLENFDVAMSDSVDGQYSYGGMRTRPDGTVSGRLFYPTSSVLHYIDSGIVNSNASEGAFILPSSSLKPGGLAEMKGQLVRVRPFGGTPTAAALDDLYFAFSDQAEGFAPKPHIVLITDGAPDDDFREYPVPGCDCTARGNCPADEDPTLMSCPYPRAVDAAYRLRCGYDPMVCAGPVARIDVVSYLLEDLSSRLASEFIADAGGGSALHTTSLPELKAALDTVLGGIVAP